MDQNNWRTCCRCYFILLAMISLTSRAIEQTSTPLELSPFANLSIAAIENDQWLSVLPVLGDENQFFLATKSGKIYLLTHSEISSGEFFNLTTALDNSMEVELNAITLDPNFYYRDRDGYQTFYTAHTEKSKKVASKLPKNSVKTETPYDAVVMRWKLASIHRQSANISQQHEVLRIAIQTPQEAIQQLSFNPYIEPWHDDFGLMFIALARSETLNNHALYDGVILRIKPEKYGLKNYTIPADNPFLKRQDITNEIIFIAGQPTEHFAWIKKSMHDFLIQLRQHESHVLVEAKIGDDWRTGIPKQQIQKHVKLASDQQKTLLYNGRDLKTLWGKALQLKGLNNEWQLQAVPLQLSNQSEETPAKLIHKLVAPDVSENAEFSLHASHNGELLLLEHTAQRLYSVQPPELVQNNEPSVTEVINQPTSTTNPAMGILFLLMISILFAVYYWYVCQKKHSKQHFLQEQWGNFDIDLTNQLLALYKRHMHTPEKTIAISSIITSELLLNNHVISTVSAAPEHALSNNKEEQVLTIFAKEHRVKMIDSKQRIIQLRITDDQHNSYLICLYFRIGNIRHTKLKYQQIIDKTINWQWQLAETINPSTTSKRIVLEKPRPASTQHNNKKPTATVSPSQSQALDDHSLPSSDDGNLNQHDEKLKQQVTDSSNVENQPEISKKDTQLVSALDKLVLMNKQGYLSDEEFNTAKAKILQDLMND